MSGRGQRSTQPGSARPTRIGRAIGAALLLAVVAGGAGHAVAETTPPAALTVTTPFPSIDTQPGSSVTLDLTVASPTIESVDLAIDGLPD
ncbi:MAG: hypothetical protein HZB15_04745, partial [Actinobacteria bacterium]|nr:hypothetical protein [Actinomycetota bacterium]